MKFSCKLCARVKFNKIWLLTYNWYNLINGKTCNLSSSKVDAGAGAEGFIMLCAFRSAVDLIKFAENRKWKTKQTCQFAKVWSESEILLKSLKTFSELLSKLLEKGLRINWARKVERKVFCALTLTKSRIQKHEHFDSFSMQISSSLVPLLKYWMRLGGEQSYVCR